MKGFCTQTTDTRWLPRCPQCRAEAKRVFTRRSKQEAKLKIVNLQQENLELEAELDDQEDVCDEIWAKKLAYEQNIEDLLHEREVLHQLTMNN